MQASSGAKRDTAVGSERASWGRCDDFMVRAAAATGSSKVIDSVVDLLVDVAPQVADASLEMVIQEAILLGDRRRGTHEGNIVADHLFARTRRFLTQIGVAKVDAMVRRGETYSRAGPIALGILYDDDTERVSTLKLTDHFLQRDLPNIAFNCAFRERWPSIAYFGDVDHAFRTKAITRIGPRRSAVSREGDHHVRVGHGIG